MLKYKRCILYLIIPLAFSSCSFHYFAYIRNLTSEIAIIDIYSKDKSLAKIVSPYISRANKVVTFEKGYRKQFNDSMAVQWLDSTHCIVAIPPQTTINFGNIGGYFLNGRPTNNIKVIVSTKNTKDTLMDGRAQFRMNKFKYRQNGFLPKHPLLYYDIIDK